MHFFGFVYLASNELSERYEQCTKTRKIVLNVVQSGYTASMTSYVQPRINTMCGVAENQLYIDHEASRFVPLQTYIKASFWYLNDNLNH